jgi:hypothetical protein
MPRFNALSTDVVTSEGMPIHSDHSPSDSNNGSLNRLRNPDLPVAQDDLLGKSGFNSVINMARHAAPVRRGVVDRLYRSVSLFELKHPSYSLFIHHYSNRRCSRAVREFQSSQPLGRKIIILL